MIEARHLTKRYGDRLAVDDVSFVVQPGTVTGFLGPNGAGKSTTMRLIVGLNRPTAGTVTVNGKAFVSHPAPLSQVGALLDAKAIHPGRTAFSHLYGLALTCGLPKRRVREVLEFTGLSEVANKRFGGFSLGMGQRLGIATALLGDPDTYLFDEPVNGLDPDGVMWVRGFVKQLAADGKCVFLSSHLMSEMELTADHLIVIGRGRILAQGPLREVVASAGRSSVRVRTPQAAALTQAVRARLAGAEVTALTEPRVDDAEALAITGTDIKDIGRLIAAQGIVVYELSPQRASLEDAYLALTGDEVEYRSQSLGESGQPVREQPDGGAPDGHGKGGVA
ncbi:MAG: ATP-binding cassette domain-containing protein [Actinomycetia bacterium]|nr:ATP-binding cassette domain-containing protein [Actinomycetes bacterium]